MISTLNRSETFLFKDSFRKTYLMTGMAGSHPFVETNLFTYANSDGSGHFSDFARRVLDSDDPTKTFLDLTVDEIIEAFKTQTIKNALDEQH
jgi:hypothetical protein